MYLSAEDIESLISMKEVIDIIEIAFGEMAKGKVIMPPRTTVMLKNYNGSISLMPSYIPSMDAFATKIISIYPDNREKSLPTTAAWIFVNNPENGQLEAIMDGTYITALRTGAVTGVAAKYLAPKNSKIAAVFGCGVQGRTQAWALAETLELEMIRVYDLSEESMMKFSDEMTEKLGVDVIPSESGRAAVEDADVVATATTSPRPVLHREWLKDKVHVSAIGAFYPDYRELDTKIIKDSKLVVDEIESIMHEAGDVLIPIKEGIITADHIYCELGDIIIDRKEGRTKRDGITVFKSVGVAIQDSSVSSLILKKWRETQ